jgi:UDP:flavonoid glycosyltransferase YjiC (YdhE family)
MSYADLLWSQGWSDRASLWATLGAWTNLYRLFQPEVVVLDYSPTARLAAHLMQVPCVMIGTGFELPPDQDPLPPFPGFPFATPALAAASGRRTLEHVNSLLSEKGCRPLDSLSRLVQGDAVFLTTVPELDHYPTRGEATYVGPIADRSHGLRMDWPSDSRKRVFAYVRPAMRNLCEVMEGLIAADVSVIAYAPGMERDVVQQFQRPDFQIASSPVQYDSVFPQADLCVSYGPAGTVAASLLQGVPQLVFPLHVESQLTAHRIENLGVGRSMQREFKAKDVSRIVKILSNSIDYKLRARSLSNRYRNLLPSKGIDTIAAAIESLAHKAGSHRSPLTESASIGRSFDPSQMSAH